MNHVLPLIYKWFYVPKHREEVFVNAAIERMNNELGLRICLSETNDGTGMRKHSIVQLGGGLELDHG